MLIPGPSQLQFVGSNTAGIYVGNAVSIGNSGQANLTWDTLSFGSAVLNIGTPSAPTVVSTGMYYVSVDAQGTNLTTNGFFTMQLILKRTGDSFGAEVNGDSRLSSVANNDPEFGLGMCWYLTAGTPLNVNVTNFDGTTTRDFSLIYGVVQKIW